MESQNAVRIFDVHILLNIFVSLVFKGKGALLKEVCSLCCHELLLLSLAYFFRIVHTTTGAAERFWSRGGSR